MSLYSLQLFFLLFNILLLLFSIIYFKKRFNTYFVLSNFWLAVTLIAFNLRYYYLINETQIMQKYSLSEEDLIKANFIIFLINIIILTVSIISNINIKQKDDDNFNEDYISSKNFLIVFYTSIFFVYIYLIYILFAGHYDSTSFSLQTLIFIVPMSLLNYKAIINKDTNSLLNLNFVLSLIPLFFTSNRIFLIALVLNFLIFNAKDINMKVKSISGTIAFSVALYSLYFVIIKSYWMNKLNIFNQNDRFTILDGLKISILDGIYPLLESFAIILKEMPGKYQFHYGESYVNIFLMPVPDSIIKGPELLSFWFNHYFNTTQYYSVGTGQLPGLIGELYMSGGLINLFIFIILLTVIYAIIFRKVLYRTTQLNKYIYISLLTLILIFFRDGFSTIYLHVYLLTIILPIILLRRKNENTLSN